MENWKVFKESSKAIWQISDHGRVKKNGEIYTPYYRGGHKNSQYLCLANIEPLGGYIHRITATTFIPNPENKRTVNHIDGDKTNNHISNLEWATYSENQKHGHKLGLISPRPRALTDEERAARPELYAKRAKEYYKKTSAAKKAERLKAIDTAKQLFGCTINDSKYTYDHLLEVAIWLAERNVKLTYKIARDIFVFPKVNIAHDMCRVNRYMKDLKQQ